MPSSSSVTDILNRSVFLFHQKPRHRDNGRLLIFPFLLSCSISFPQQQKIFAVRPSPPPSYTQDGRLLPSPERLLPKPCNSLACNPASDGSPRYRRLFRMHLIQALLFFPFYSVLSFFLARHRFRNQVFTPAFLLLPTSTLLACFIIVLT